MENSFEDEKSRLSEEELDLREKIKEIEAASQKGTLSERYNFDSNYNERANKEVEALEQQIYKLEKKKISQQEDKSWAEYEAEKELKRLSSPEWAINHTFKPDQASGIEIPQESGRFKPEPGQEAEPPVVEPVVPVVPPALPEILTRKSDIIDTELAALGITREQLATIDSFKKIAGSDGRILSVLSNLSHIRLNRAQEKARMDTEQYVRTSENLGQRIWRGFGPNRRKEIRLRTEEEAKKPFDISEYEAEVKTLIDTASFGPEIHVKRNPETSEFEGTVAEYLSSETLPKEQVERFNEAATRLADIPLENEWHKDESRIPEYEKITNAFKAEREALLETGGPEALTAMTNIDFQIPMARGFKTYPDGATELLHMIESHGWERQLDVIKAQMGPGIVGFSVGIGFRIGSKSAIGAMLGTVAMPATAIGLAGAFGALRGVEKAQENLIKQDEYMRIDMEQSASMGKGTKANFVRVEKLTQKMNELKDEIAHEQDLEKRAVLSQRLQARIAYAARKAEEGRIVFGKNAEALAKQYAFMEDVADAAVIAERNFDPSVKEFADAKDLTRRDRLERFLAYKERLLQWNRNWYKGEQAVVSGAVGLATAGVGYYLYELGGMIHGYFGSSGAHEVANHAQALRADGEYPKASQLEKLTNHSVNQEIKHETKLEVGEKLEEVKKAAAPESPKEMPKPTRVPSPDDVRLDIRTKPGDITRDLPRSPYTKDLESAVKVSVPEEKPVILEAVTTPPAATPIPNVETPLSPLEEKFPVSAADSAPRPELDPVSVADVAEEKPDAAMMEGAPNVIPDAAEIGAEPVLTGTYEAAVPTSLPQILVDMLRFDGRTEDWTDIEKDKVAYELFVNHFLKNEQLHPGFLSKVGITSGNPFVVEKGAVLHLGIEGKDIYDNAMKRVLSGDVAEDVKGFRENLAKLAVNLHDVELKDLTTDRIVEELQKVRK